MNKNNNALFYTCSLIEFISRRTKNHRSDVVSYLGEDIERIYNYDSSVTVPVIYLLLPFITRFLIASLSVMVSVR